MKLFMYIYIFVWNFLHIIWNLFSCIYFIHCLFHGFLLFFSSSKISVWGKIKMNRNLIWFLTVWWISLIKQDWEECTVYCSAQNSQHCSLWFLKLTCSHFINVISTRHKMSYRKQEAFIFQQHNKAQYCTRPKSVK